VNVSLKLLPEHLLLSGSLSNRRAEEKSEDEKLQGSSGGLDIIGREIRYAGVPSSEVNGENPSRGPE